MESINKKFKNLINEKGLKMTKVAELTGINYQRLNRLFNQNALMSATEFITLCSFLDVNPNGFLEAA